MKYLCMIILTLSLCVIAYAEEPTFNLALQASSAWDSSDPIYNKITGTGDFARSFENCFKEYVCNLTVDMIPPSRGPSWIYNGGVQFIPPPTPKIEAWLWGTGFDVKAIPLNQEALDLLNIPTNLAQIWWINGRIKGWLDGGNQIIMEEIQSDSPSEWNGWFMDGIYYPNQKMNIAKEIGDYEYEIDYTLRTASQSRTFENTFYVMDHPAIAALSLWLSYGDVWVLHLNFKVQLVRNNPYTVLAERDFHVKIRLQIIDTVDCRFDGPAPHIGINHISIPDWVNPPN